MIDGRHRGRIILAAYLLFCIIYLGAPRLAISKPHVLQPSAIDRAIPFLPWTIAIYASQFLFLFLALWKSLKEVLIPMGIATALSAVIFIVWPTTIIRPDARNAAFSTLYVFDVPTNCFPSLHVALALIAAWLWPHPRTGALVWASAIALSTLTTKQHVAVDVLGGAVVGAVASILAGVWRRRAERPGVAA